ncbi:uncharacterized protein LOC107475584 [Arachis duranensis]|uniref:Uncharacterized protein LOC107475584 n=1 Tax=Arachis duranensis TaxID=130453 RepID=A0A6P4CGF1_ARADU|nr:uncharacterized protein LOC107475584 [Arachis duranensis]
MLKVDELTSIHSRRKFARICVEIDLRKKMVPTITALDKEFNIVYEGLHQICFNCGKYRHRMEYCNERTIGTTTEAAAGMMEGTRSSHRKSPNGQKTNQNTQNQQSNLEKKENLAAIIMNEPPITPEARHQNKQVFQNMAINQESIYEEQNWDFLDHTTKVLITSIMGSGYNNEISKEEGNKPPDLSEFSSKPKKNKNMKKLDLQKGEVTYQNVEMDVQAINSKTNEAQ